MDALRFGRLTALRKPCGGVRGIVAGDVVRRLVSRTMTQQLGTLWNLQQHRTSSPQDTCRMRVHCTRFARFVRRYPNPTISSIDGIGAFDPISRAAMLEGLMNVEGGGQAIPFVRSFNGSPSSCGSVCVRYFTWTQNLAQKLWETASMPLCLGGMGFRDASKGELGRFHANDFPEAP